MTSPEETALLALERKVRSQLLKQANGVGRRIAPVIIAKIQQYPTATGTQILSDHEVYATLTSELEQARQEATARVSLAWRAAEALALAAIAAELAQFGHTVGVTPTGYSSYLMSLLRDVALAYSQTLLEVQNSVRAAVDGILGKDSTSARKLAAIEAVRRAVRKLSRRVEASGVVAVHRAYNESTAAAMGEYSRVNPYVRVQKQWSVTSADPCVFCAALDGTVVDLDADFDHSAGAESGRTLAVYGGLAGPPRHPRCRCKLVLRVDAGPRE